MTTVLALVSTLFLQAGARPTVDVAALLEPIRARHELPGLVAAIVDRDGAAAVGACGVRARGDEAALKTTDRMHLGSCTKAMTATLCAKLVDAKELAWTTTIGASFADWGDAVDAGWKDVTLEQLLTHRAGVPRDVEPALWARLFSSKDAPRAQREQLARGTFAKPPKHAPGAAFEYSNTGIAIAGLMAERATKKDWEELMRAELFAPLGMSTAGFGAPGKTGVIDEPRGHRANGKFVEVGPGSDNPPAIGPGGTVHASIGDWAEFAALHLRGVKDGGLDIAASTFARMHAPPADGLEPYAMGWMALERRWGGRVLTHSGSNTMWFCVAWLSPEKEFGVLVATNQAGDSATKACDEAAAALIGAWTKK